MNHTPLGGTFGSFRPLPPSRKHLVIHLLDQFIVHHEWLVAMQDAYFDTSEEFNRAVCHGLAVKLTRSYHINASAAGLSRQPRHEFTSEMQPIYEAVCAEQSLHKSIMGATGTLDVEALLRINGKHLYIEVTTYPFQSPFSNPTRLF